MSTLNNLFLIWFPFAGCGVFAILGTYYPIWDNVTVFEHGILGIFVGIFLFIFINFIERLSHSGHNDNGEKT